METLEEVDENVKKIWEKYKKSRDSIETAEEIFFKSVLNKKTKKEIMKPCLIYFCENKIIYFKEVKPVYSKKKIDFIYALKVEWINKIIVKKNENESFSDVSSNESDQEKKVEIQTEGLRFVLGKYYSEFYSEDSEMLMKLKSYLATRINFLNFHDYYFAVKLLGKGSFASVYLAKHRLTGEEYAVKSFLKAKAFAKNKGKEGIINEIAIMRKLDHPGIMKLYEIHETPRSIYMILELLEGGRLLDVVDKAKKNFITLTEEDIGVILKKVLFSLNYIHQKGIMHRDLKLENLVFKNKTSYMSMYLVDFGLSTFVDQDTYLYYRCGSPGYIAPEILALSKDESRKYNTQCDIFSLGVIAFALFFKKMPFESSDKDPKKILSKNKNCEIDWTNHVAFEFVQMMLEKNPNKRITAYDALRHSFLKNIETDISIEYIEENFEINDYYGEPISRFLPKFNKNHKIRFHKKNYLKGEQKLRFVENLNNSNNHIGNIKSRSKSISTVNSGGNTNKGESSQNFSIMMKSNVLLGTINSIKTKSILDKTIFNLDKDNFNHADFKYLNTQNTFEESVSKDLKKSGTIGANINKNSVLKPKSPKKKKTTEVITTIRKNSHMLTEFVKLSD